MIGQKNLIKKLKNYTINNLPHSIVLIGEDGSEEKEVCNFISDYFNLSQFDLTDFISKEMIDEIYASHTATLYIIDISKLDERKQNILLKFYEEPNDYTYIILLCESDNDIIDTIKTRSYIFKKDIYKKEDLVNLISNIPQEDISIVLNICHTPGQIEIANHTDIKSLYNLCVNIIDSMSKASYQNSLTIADKINYKDNYDKYDLNIFIKMMRYVSLIKGRCDIYKLLIELCHNLNSMNNKQNRVENFITQWWLLCK
jgi:hypothetical protein